MSQATVHMVPFLMNWLLPDAGRTKKRPEQPNAAWSSPTQPGAARRSLEQPGKNNLQVSSPTRVFLQTNKVLWWVVIYILLIHLFQILLTFMVEHDSMTADFLGSQALSHYDLFNWCSVSVHYILYYGKFHYQEGKNKLYSYVKET